MRSAPPTAGAGKSTGLKSSALMEIGQDNDVVLLGLVGWVEFVESDGAHPEAASTRAAHAVRIVGMRTR
jgi:hypothetical protein